MNASIRPAEKRDYQEIITILNQAIANQPSTGFLSPFTVSDRKDWFEEHTLKKYPLLVAELKGQIVGWISISPYRKGRSAFRKTVEVSFFVHQQFKKQGIGSRLLSEMISIAKKLGYTCMIAIILDENNASKRLLEKNDFEQWGFLPGVALISEKIYGHLYYGRKL
jgi:phosphinothricin acetyltransferase